MGNQDYVGLTSSEEDGMHPNRNKDKDDVLFDNKKTKVFSDDVILIGEESPLTFTVFEFLNGHNFIGLLQ